MGTVTISRGAIGWLGACLAGAISTASFVLAIPYAQAVPVFFLGSILCILPLFIVGLGAGFIASLISILVASLGIALFMPIGLLTGYLILFAFPTALMVGLALRYRVGVDQKIYWYPEGYLLSILLTYACGLFIVANIMAYNKEFSLYEQTVQAFTIVMDALILQISKISAGEPNADLLANYAAGIEAMRKMLPTAAFYLPAMLGGFWFSLVVTTGVSAQIINAGQKWNLRDRFSLTGIHLPTSLYIVAGVAGVASIFAPAPFNYIGANICILLCLAITLVGLDVVHVFARTTQRPRLVLTLFYLLLAILFWLTIFLTLLGVADHGLHLRQRLISKLPKTV